MIETSLLIKTTVATHSRINEINATNLPFGKYFSDHMFVCEYVEGEWQNFRIMPYGPLPMSPSISALHYGQAIFEGMKAHKTDEGVVQIFRPLENHKRLNISAHRMCMPEIPENIFMEGLFQLLRLDINWVLKDEGCSLYIRPVMFAIDEALGVKTSGSYRFVIMTSPVGPYYKDPVRMKIETKYARACEGGVGFTKAAGNYGVSLYPAKNAQQEGYTQVIWTDVKEHLYIEEAGMMNVMFMIGNTLITPTINGNTILAGVTRDSLITLARDWNIKVEERKVSVKEVVDGIDSDNLIEAFGVGTAATVALISTIGYNGKDYSIPAATPESFSNKAAKHINSIRKGRTKDAHNWMVKI